MAIPADHASPPHTPRPFNGNGCGTKVAGLPSWSIQATSYTEGVIFDMVPEAFKPWKSHHACLFKRRQTDKEIHYVLNCLLFKNSSKDEPGWWEGGLSRQVGQLETEQRCLRMAWFGSLVKRHVQKGDRWSVLDGIELKGCSGGEPAEQDWWELVPAEQKCSLQKPAQSSLHFCAEWALTAFELFLQPASCLCLYIFSL